MSVTIMKCRCVCECEDLECEVEAERIGSVVADSTCCDGGGLRRRGDKGVDKEKFVV